MLAALVVRAKRPWRVELAGVASERHRDLADLRNADLIGAEVFGVRASSRATAWGESPASAC